MIDIVNKRCIYNECKKMPNFNKVGYNKGIYCFKHKFPNMIDVKHKQCQYLGCKKRPTYNIKYNKQAIYCFKHKTPNMVDVRSKQCQYNECNTRVYYGKLFLPKTHCAKHRTKNEYVKNNPKCEHNGCKIKPFYSDDNYPKRCEEHKLDTDSNIIETECDSCGLSNYINNTLGLCNDCYDYTIKRVHKSKEEKMSIR